MSNGMTAYLSQSLDLIPSQYQITSLAMYDTDDVKAKIEYLSANLS